MNGDIEGTDDCGCEPWHETGILAGLRFPWDDDVGYASIDVCDCDAAGRFKDIWAASLALSELTGRIVVNVDLRFHDGQVRPCCVLANEDGTPMTTAQGDAFKEEWRAAHPVRRPAPPPNPNACGEPACERCPRIARGESCSPGCPGWLLDRRGRVEPCDDCGLLDADQAAQRADAFVRARCYGVAVRLCTTLDERRAFYAIMSNADGTEDGPAPWLDSEAQARACDAARAAGMLVPDGAANDDAKEGAA